MSQTDDYKRGYSAGYAAGVRNNSYKARHGHEHDWIDAADQSNAGKMSVIKTCKICHIEQGFLKEEIDNDRNISSNMPGIYNDNHI
jgi:hypothetical protein